jgi:hypothetical protein
MLNKKLSYCNKIRIINTISSFIILMGIVHYLVNVGSQSFNSIFENKISSKNLKLYFNNLNNYQITFALFNYYKSQNANFTFKKLKGLIEDEITKHLKRYSKQTLLIWKSSYKIVYIKKSKKSEILFPLYNLRC